MPSDTFGFLGQSVADLGGTDLQRNILWLNGEWGAKPCMEGRGVQTHALAVSQAMSQVLETSKVPTWSGLCPVSVLCILRTPMTGRKVPSPPPHSGNR